MLLPATTALGSRYPLLPLAHEVDHANAECLTDGAQLDQVKASLTGLVLADEGLGAVEQFGEVYLCDVGVCSRLTQELDQVEVLRRVDGALHLDSWQSQSGISKVGIASRSSSQR